MFGDDHRTLPTYNPRSRPLALSRSRAGLRALIVRPPSGRAGLERKGEREVNDHW